MVRTAARPPRLSEEVVEALRRSEAASAASERDERRGQPGKNFRHRPGAGLSRSTRRLLGRRGGVAWRADRPSGRRGPRHRPAIGRAPAQEHRARACRGGGPSSPADLRSAAKALDLKTHAAGLGGEHRRPLLSSRHGRRARRRAKLRPDAGNRHVRRAPARGPGTPAWWTLSSPGPPPRGKLTRPSPEPRSCCRLLTRSSGCTKVDATNPAHWPADHGVGEGRPGSSVVIDWRQDRWHRALKRRSIVWVRVQRLVDAEVEADIDTLAELRRRGTRS